MNATLVGISAILIWGASLPIIRMLEERLNVAATIGLVYLGTATFGVIEHFLRRKNLPGKTILKHRCFYGRWFFYVLHETLCISAVGIVQSANLPLVILINYLWPTAIIVFSVLLAGVTITRWPIFLCGTLVVLSSLWFELVGPGASSIDFISSTQDQLAYLMAFVGAICWGLYCALTRKSGEESGGATVLPLFQMTLALALPISFMLDSSRTIHLSTSGIWLLIFYCLAQCIAYRTWDFGMKKGSIVILSLCADFIPWIALAATYLLLAVEIKTTTIYSAIILVLGAIITRYGTLPLMHKAGKSV